MNNGHTTTESTSVPHTPRGVKAIVKTAGPTDMPATLPADLTKEYTETIPTKEVGPHPSDTVRAYPPAEQQKIGTIYRKMAQIMKEIGAVGKDQTNTTQGFKFRGIDQFINALHPALTKYGVFVVPQNVSYKTEIREVVRSNGKTGVDKHVELLTNYTFTAEDGSSVTVGPIPSEGVDSGDKATNKALSAGLKYALIQTFQVPTQDMEEGDKDSPELGAPAKKTAEAPSTTTRRGFNAPARQTTPAAQSAPATENKQNDAGLGYPPANGTAGGPNTAPAGSTLTATTTTAPTTETVTPNTATPADVAPTQATTEAAPKRTRVKFTPRTTKTETREE